MKRSVILTDRLGPDILLVLTMKRQVLHRERAHLKAHYEFSVCPHTNLVPRSPRSYGREIW